MMRASGGRVRTDVDAGRLDGAFEVEGVEDHGLVRLLDAEHLDLGRLGGKNVEEPKITGA